MTQAARTIIDKIWDAHVILTQGEEDLLHVDRHLVHEGSHHAFAQVAASGRPVRRPDLTFAFADHYIATRPARAVPENDAMVDRLAGNADLHAIPLYGRDHPRQGIAHVSAPELGLSLPGTLIVCGDSHTSTHGALGALAFGIGASEVAHVLQTQTIWQGRPKRMRLNFDGALPRWVTAKDLALHMISTLGSDFALGHAVEYRGAALDALTVEGRMTLCNMTIEFGARFGLIAPDERLFEYLKGRPHAPQGDDWDRAIAWWCSLASDAGAAFDREVSVDVSAMQPVVTWGIVPEQAVPVTGNVPDPAAADSAGRARVIADALDYMGLTPGMPLEAIPIDQVFIGSCTNGRIEDLRMAARMLRGRKAVVPGLVSPGSTGVRRQAEAEGLDRVFAEAGLEWAGSGCSMCVGMNGDLLPEGARCASTTNRNFRGRQGRGSRTHLVSPATAAASALTGRLTDPRIYLEGTES